MDLMMLWENFEVIAEAENGIQQLQELVFSLAIRGAFKLQHSNDKPASKLLEKATQEKLSQVKNQRKRQTKEINPIEIPEDWNLPSNWEWSSLENLGTINPRNEISDDLNTGFVPMPLVPTDYRDAVSFETKQWSKIKKGYTHFANDDVALAKITPCFENRKSVVFSNLPNGYGSGTTELIIFRPISGVLNSKFVLLFFKSPFFLENGANQLTGTAGQKRVPRDFVAKCPFPLPPLEEQKRIVKKVDELMELCDRAQASKKNRNELQQQLRRSAIHALETAETEEDFKKSWRFVRDNFSAIMTQANGIKEFRDLILDLGVKGRLVSQFSNDTTTLKALDQMKLEKAEILQNSRSRKKTKRKSIERFESGIEFKIPKGWISVELDDISIFIDYRGKTPPKTKSGVKLITAKNVRDGVINLEPQEFISEDTYKTWMTRGFPRKGDVLFTTEAPLGKAAVVEVKERFALAQRIINIQPLSGVSGYFLMWLILSPWFQGKLREKATGMTAKGIKASKLKLIEIPLPPLEEQKRIVSKVDELMKCCDRVEESLSKKEELASAISASVIHHLEL